MRLLLVNPKSPESFWSFKWAVDVVLPHKRALNPPLGLATLAALCPEHWEVSIVDENIEPIPLDPRADLIGICGMGVQFARQRELLTYYRSKGYYVVAGGSYASLCPELYASLADTVVAGEAEYIWREFCRDIASGQAKRLYQERGTVSLTDSPVPRFDLLDLPKYQTVSLQFSRGCPFRCEFCDIIVMFGRRPRTKPIEQVGRELDVLRARNVRNAFFVDDNFIGNKPAAKELLKFLADYQRVHDYQFRFGTEASINLAHDDELLELFRQASFAWVFIGIESPDADSLKETRKYQNVRRDLLSSVRHIYSHGVEVLGGFIVGFDNDTVDTFDRQYEFIMQSGIQTAMLGLLTALPKTPLYERLQEEGRLIAGASDVENTRLATNFIPKRMGYDELISGYRRLLRRLVRYDNIASRIRNKFRYLKHPLGGRDWSWVERLQMLGRIVVHGLMRGGVARFFHFFRSIPFSRPRLIPLAMQDWVVGMSMRDYVNRYFVEVANKVKRPEVSYFRSIEKAFRRYVRQGALKVSLDEVMNAGANLSLSMRAGLDRKFFARAARQLETVLTDTTSSVTLQIEELQAAQRRHLQRMLERLSRYGDRLYISAREELREMIEIDWSVFRLVPVS
ncbi:MAG: B12-binding domain-containing radical SAM protein [Gemmatimonadota bacterium]|nr:MAG: B12-binding domain-containing radical SAM protein [Gemmatimonadota bacterium]